MAQQMGLGVLANESLVFKRKYRWTFRVKWNGKQIPEAFVKVANRPSLTIEQTEINYLHGKMWIPGKGTWETLTVSYYDIAGNGVGASGMGTMWEWLTSVYDFTNPATLQQTSRRGRDGDQTGWAALGFLQMYDGTGETMETWELRNLWPAAVNFGDLDYGSSEVASLDLTMRFSEARYTPGCGVQIGQPGRLGCAN